LEKLSHESEFGKDVKRINLALATQVWGQDHSLDIPDFESPSDFIGRGIGYYAEKNGKMLGCAYSSLVCSQGIEVSIFVSEEYRRQGIATTLAAHLLKGCLGNHMDPHWDAANPESCTLAEKLGYLPKGAYQAYFLKS
jgi:GNAT superfamily N-acetyltransferase